VEQPRQTSDLRAQGRDGADRVSAQTRRRANAGINATLPSIRSVLLPRLPPRHDARIDAKLLL